MKVNCKIDSTCVPLVWILREHFGNDTIELRGPVRSGSVRGERIVMHDPIASFKKSAGEERMASRDCFVENCSQRENVRTAIGLLLLNDFGRHITQGACKLSPRADT